MPGMRLTPAQVERLAGVERAICQTVLDDLTRARFLYAAADGSYGRVSEGSPSMAHGGAPSRLGGAPGTLSRGAGR